MQATGASAAAPTAAATGTEDVLIRNHDFQWGYDLELRASKPDGTTALEARYYLQPGGTRSEFGALEPGTYEVEVVLDGDREAARTCRLDGGPADGVLVELGNGAVSVHDGLYG